MRRFSQNITGRIKTPRYKSDEHEFEKGSHGVLYCKECGIYYFEKSWHHASSPKIQNSGVLTRPRKEVLCPACQMIRDNLYEGRLRIADTPKKFHDELVNLIKGFCERSWQKDPLDRLIRIDESGSEIEVLTTENQLTQKLGKKIVEVFHNVDIKISYPKVPGDAVEIRLTFLPHEDEK